MLGQPCKRLAAYERLAGDVGCRCSIFQHRYIAVVLLCETWVTAQSFDAEFRESESLDLGNVNGSIDINQIGGRAMCLVAGFHTVAVSPCRPLLGEILEQHLAQGLTVVRECLTLTIEQEVESFFQLVTASLCELVEQGRGPVGTIYFIRVVEEIVRIRCA